MQPGPHAPSHGLSPGVRGAHTAAQAATSKHAAVPHAACASRLLRSPWPGCPVFSSPECTQSFQPLAALAAAGRAFPYPLAPPPLPQQVQPQLGMHINAEKHCLWGHYTADLLYAPAGFNLPPARLSIGGCGGGKGGSWAATTWMLPWARLEPEKKDFACSDRYHL